MNHNYIEVVATSDAGFRRMLWIRDSGNPPGVRYGLVDKNAYGGHMTHYANGTAHIESGAGILSEYDYIVPSNLDANYYILGNASVFFENFPVRTELDEKGGRDYKTIEVQESKAGASIWINLYLARNEIAHAVTSEILADNTGLLLTQEIIELNHTPSYSLVVLVVDEKS